MTIQTQRSITMPGIWAKNAATTIPNPPIPGQAYRNPSLDKATIEAGQAYSSRADSAQWNQWNYSCSVLESEIERYGVLPYSPLTTYPINGICLGDGVIYQAVQENGPGTTIGPVQPGNETVWTTIVDPKDAFCKFHMVNGEPKFIYVNSINGIDGPGRGTIDMPFKTFLAAYLYGSATYIPQGRAVRYKLIPGGTYSQDGMIYINPLTCGENLRIESSVEGQKASWTGGMWIKDSFVALYDLALSGVINPSYNTNFLAQSSDIRIARCSFNANSQEICIFSDLKSNINIDNSDLTGTNAYAFFRVGMKSILYLGYNISINGTTMPVGYTFIITFQSSVITLIDAIITGTVTGGKPYWGEGMSMFSVYKTNFAPGVGNGLLTNGTIYF